MSHGSKSGDEQHSPDEAAGCPYLAPVGSASSQAPSHPDDTGMLEFDLESDDFRRDPYPTYLRLRQHAPVHFYLPSGGWLISRHEDCRLILNDPETFTTVGYSFDRTLLGADGPAHQRVRSIARRLFKPSHISALKLKIRPWAVALLDRAAAEPSVDFMRAVARPLPLRVTAHLLGVGEEHAPSLELWSELLLKRESPLTDDARTRHLDECREFFRRHIAHSKENPRSDAFQSLLKPTPSGDRLSDAELLDICQVMMIGGWASTENTLGNALSILANDDDIFQQLKKRTTLIPSFIEELLRFESPVREVRRNATTATEVHGQSIGQGDWLRLLLGSANRDESVFPEAEKFRLDRPSNPHLAFGAGPHQCLGFQLARVEVQILVELLLERFETLSGVCQPDDSEFRVSTFIRGPQTLRMTS